jgi:formylglycine-generating enzyme required for sulfatase activity
VGLPDEAGTTPEDRDMSVPNVYPWGSAWPPPPGSGNYCGQETRNSNPIQGYTDEYEYTSPVGKFKPTPNGLYDMSGNVFQWVADDWNKDHNQKTLRGSSWQSGDIQLGLLTSCRFHFSPTLGSETNGFRIVKAPDSNLGKR